MNEPEKNSTLSRAFALLDCFSVDRPALGVREAARMVKLSTSTTGRLMSLLKDMGVLRQNPETKLYSLGGRVLSWAGVYSSTLDVRNAAIGLMKELWQETQETISLYVLEGDERVCVERLESQQNVRIVARLGKRLPLYAGSAGKVFLAFLPPARCKEILDRTDFYPLTPFTYTVRQDLETELGIIAGQGFAVSHGEWVADASGVAAPIFAGGREIVAVLTISGPSARFSPERISHFSQRVVEVAAQLSQQMGHRQVI